MMPSKNTADQLNITGLVTYTQVSCTE